MRWSLCLLAVAFTACSGSPAAPAPIPSAHLAPNGQLNVQGCTETATGMFLCSRFTGTLTNDGPGCAMNLRGLTKTFIINTQTVVGTAEWTYGLSVKPGESVSYAGANLAVPAPLTGGWLYTTMPTYDSVACP